MSPQKQKNVGKIAGVPYDFNKPTKARFLSRVWNPNAPFINPRYFGAGFDFNFYVIVHPLKWRKARHSTKTK